MGDAELLFQVSNALLISFGLFIAPGLLDFQLLERDILNCRSAIGSKCNHLIRQLGDVVGLGAVYLHEREERV